MNAIPQTAAFFDFASTLATVQVAPDGDHIEAEVYPGVIAVLETLAREGVRLGIIAGPGAIYTSEIRAALKRGGIASVFDESLILLGSTLSPRLFREAAALVGSDTGCERATLLYVGEDAGARAQARSAGFRTAPHPALVHPLIERLAPLQYLRIEVPAEPGDWLRELRKHALVPFFLTAPRAPGVSCLLYAIADAATVLVLEERHLPVNRLGPANGPESCSAYLLPIRPQVHGSNRKAVRPLPAHLGSGPLESCLLLDTTADGHILAVPTDRPLSSWSFMSSRHGHPVKLIPTVTLLEPAPALAEHAASVSPAVPPGLLSKCEVAVFTRRITASRMARDVARYSGTGAGSQDRRILSRHIHHPHNARAVEALVDDLVRAGRGILQVRRHCFRHDERTLHNVVATLPRSAGMTRREIVVVGAHLDSTATKQPCYRPSIDPAPGADDDASGIAGVLAAARACVKLATWGIAHREIRFVLFNAEEDWLTGSGEYAAQCRAHHEVIVAMFQMDMIGHDLTPPRRFELHAGLVPRWPSDGGALQDASRRLAELVSRLRPEVSNDLPAPEIFADHRDRGIGHSDHTRFHGSGYPACLASEDFFPGQGAAEDRNPNYHRPTDTTINEEYAADIARVVAAAAWVAATRNL